MKQKLMLLFSLLFSFTLTMCSQAPSQDLVNLREAVEKKGAFVIQQKHKDEDTQSFHSARTKFSDSSNDSRRSVNPELQASSPFSFWNWSFFTQPRASDSPSPHSSLHDDEDDEFQPDLQQQQDSQKESDPKTETTTPTQPDLNTYEGCMKAVLEQAGEIHPQPTLLDILKDSRNKPPLFTLRNTSAMILAPAIVVGGTFALFDYFNISRTVSLPTLGLLAAGLGGLSSWYVYKDSRAKRYSDIIKKVESLNHGKLQHIALCYALWVKNSHNCHYSRLINQNLPLREATYHQFVPEYEKIVNSDPTELKKAATATVVNMRDILQNVHNLCSKQNFMVSWTTTKGEHKTEDLSTITASNGDPQKIEFMRRMIETIDEEPLPATIGTYDGIR